jgi:hypothetical protein
MPGNTPDYDALDALREQFTLGTIGLTYSRATHKDGHICPICDKVNQGDWYYIGAYFLKSPLAEIETTICEKCARKIAISMMDDAIKVLKEVQ